MQTPDQEPTIINNRYRLDRQLGIGGMAEVHISKDLLLDRDVAVKILHNKFAEDESFITRFSREAQAAAKLSHPNIVAIHDIGQFENRNFIVMEYVEGQTLADYIAEGKTKEINQTVRIAIGVARGLEVAHRQGTIHRDIKPCNILMTGSGAPKIADFGIARALDTTNTALTQTGFVVGTPMYFSPEQSRGDQVDARSDLYSLGIVMYEMLNGKAPFTGDSSVSLGVKHATEQPPKANSNNPEVPSELVAIIDKLLAKNPDDRFTDATALILALKGLTSSPAISVEDKPESPATPENKPKIAPLTPPAPPTPTRQMQASDVPQGTSQQPPTVISGQYQANTAQPAMATTPPPQSGFQAPGGNVAPQSVMNHPQNQMPQQPTNQYQPPNKDKTSKVLFIVAAVFVGALATAGLSYLLFKGGGDESTKSASADTSEEEPDEKKEDDDEKKDEEPEETTKATTEKKANSGIAVPGGVALSEVSAQIQDTIGPADDIHQTISSVVEFPEFDTPDDSEIVGFDVQLDSTIDYGTDKPQLARRKSVTFVTNESDADAISTLLTDSIDGLGDPEFSETSKVTDGVTTEVRQIEYPTDEYNVNFGVELSVTDGEPAIVTIEHRDIISDSDAMEKQIANFGGWSGEAPFPEGGTFDRVSLSGGRSFVIDLSNPSKDVTAEMVLKYEGEISEEDLKEKITDSIEGSEFSINDSRGSGNIIYVFGDSIDDERSYYSGYSGSDGHTVTFNTRVK